MEHERPHLDRGAGEIERGFADVLADHVNVKKPAPHGIVPEWLIRWEMRRPVAAMEMFAEFIGVFLYVYCGIGATASFYTTQAVVPPVAGYGSILNVALAYGLAIVFALVVAGPTSGGHLSPAYTLSFVLFKGFPIRKAAQYIFAQILGAYLAALCVYAQYKQQLDAIYGALAAGAETAPLLFTNKGPPGVIALFTAPGQELGWVFLNEFLVCTVLTVLVFSVLDSSNMFVSFNNAPFIIGSGYSVMIMAFAAEGLSLNTARDLGGRMACATIWGSQCFTSQSGYAAIAALANIPATLLGAFIQVMLLSDSARPIVSIPPTANAEPVNGTSMRAISRMITGIPETYERKV